MNLFDNFNEMDAKEKVLIIGGAGLVLYFLFRSLFGTSTSIAGTTETVDTATTSAIEQAAESTENQTEIMTELITGFQSANTTSMENMQKTFAETLKTNQESTNKLLTEIQTQNSSQLTTLGNTFTSSIGTMQTAFTNALAENSKTTSEAIKSVGEQIAKMPVQQPVTPEPSPIQDTKPEEIQPKSMTVIAPKSTTVTKTFDNGPGTPPTRTTVNTEYGDGPWGGADNGLPGGDSTPNIKGD